MPPLTVFTSARAALEVTRGTAIVPTRLIYAETFNPTYTVNTIRPEEARASYEGFFQAAAGPELTTVEMAGRASYDDLIWHANQFYVALAAGVLTLGAQVWAFPPANTTDNVKTHNLQLGDSAAISAATPGIALSYGMGDTLNLHYEKNADGALTFNAKYLYAKPLTQITAFTGALSDRVTVPVSCNNTVVKDRCDDDRHHDRLRGHCGGLHAQPQPAARSTPLTARWRRRPSTGRLTGHGQRRSPVSTTRSRSSAPSRPRPSARCGC